MEADVCKNELPVALSSVGQRSPQIGGWIAKDSKVGGSLGLGEGRDTYSKRTRLSLLQGDPAATPWARWFVLGTRRGT